MNQPWRIAAACRGLDPLIFYPLTDEDDDAEPAKSVCALCPVREPCLEHALGRSREGRRLGRRDRARTPSHHPPTPSYCLSPSPAKRSPSAGRTRHAWTSTRWAGGGRCCRRSPRVAISPARRRRRRWGRSSPGDATPAQIAAFIIALRIKGETVDEMSGMVDAMLAAASPIELPFEARDAIDIVGTGGAPSRRVHALNVSTMACFVAAGAGVKVCKHGNRKASSTSGSFDLLEALGVPLELDGPAVSLCVAHAGVGFCFARAFHPAMRFAGPGAGRARCAHRVQLPRPLVEPGQGAASSDRRERRPHGAHGHRCAPSPPCAAGDGRPRTRRHGRAHHHGPVDRARAERRNGADL